MRRVKVTLSYDGNYFSGFQIQRGSKDITVAGEVERALKKIGIPSTIMGSGRTDRGVHATAQVIHLDIPNFWEDVKRLQKTLNLHLHPHIHIKDISLVSEDFHARFSAKKRLYRYLLYTGEYQPHLSSYALHVDNSIDIALLKKAMKCFVGEHNFAYFKKQGSNNKSDVREIFQSYAYEHQGLIILSIKGNAFLRSQVRIMSAFALAVAQGKISLLALKEQLELKERHFKKLTPPSGLYLCRIYY